MKFRMLGIIVVGPCLVLIALQAAAIAAAGRRLDYSVKPFEQIRPEAGLKILFLGDSTAVGLGSARPETSMAGWFAHEFPRADIENISQSGLRLAGLYQKLDEIPGNDYDLAVLQIGANDIMRMTPLENIDRDLRAILARVGKISRQVVVLHSGDIGTAPIFLWPFNRFLSRRSYHVREIYRRAAGESGAVYVDLIRFNTDRVLSSDEKKYYAADHLHLSGDGYRLWYEAIRKAMEEAGLKLEEPGKLL